MNSTVVQPPNGLAVYETEIATYWIDGDGILNSISKPPRRTIENTSENFTLVHKITGNTRVCHLVYLCNSPIPTKATRDFVARELPNVYKAMAMVSEPGLAQLIMRVLFQFRASPIPMRSFTNSERAREWLKQYR